MQKSKYYFAFLTAMIVIVFSVLLSGQAQDEAEGEGLHAVLMNGSAEEIGVVEIYEEEGVLYVEATVTGLEAGFHAFHIHTTGMCDHTTESHFTSAAGHFNPTEGTHGDHAGDMPSLLVMADGTAWLSFATDRFALADLMDEDGSAVMVHAGRDNYANIPERYGVADDATHGTGDAGARVACGVVVAGDVEDEE